jgi:hypothetical protein
MPLQSSGAISLANVQTEFGGSNPIGINEYYGVAAGVPASGTISLANFYGKSAGAPAFAGWTYMILGTSYFSSTSVSSNSFTGNTITPGIGNSPKTFSISQSKGGSSFSPPPYPTMTLQYYQGGSLNTTWTFTASYYSDYQSVSFTATFGSSSIRFNSSITDPNNYDDLDGNNYIHTDAAGFPYGIGVFNHSVNLFGAGEYDVDYDD